MAVAEIDRPIRETRQREPGIPMVPAYTPEGQRATPPATLNRPLGQPAEDDAWRLWQSRFPDSCFPCRFNAEIKATGRGKSGAEGNTASE